MINPPQPAPPAPAQPRTAEIPVVPPPAPLVGMATVPPTHVFPPAAPGTPVQPSPARATPASAADPSGFVPAFGTAAPEAPSRRRFSYGPRARAALPGAALVAIAVVLLQLGLGLSFGTESLWSVLPLWSAFASVAALAVLLVFVPDAPGRARLHPRVGRRIALAGVVGLAVFWLLVVLSLADSDRGFLLTAAVACSAAAVRLAPSRSS